MGVDFANVSELLGEIFKSSLVIEFTTYLFYMLQKHTFSRGRKSVDKPGAFAQGVRFLGRLDI